MEDIYSDPKVLEKLLNGFNSSHQDIIEAAVENIKHGKPLETTQFVEIEKLKARIYQAVLEGRVPSTADQMSFMRIREAQAYNRKPHTVNMRNPWEDFHGYDKNTLISIFSNKNPVFMSEEGKDKTLENIMKNYKAVRNAIENKYGTTTPPFKTPWNAPETGSKEAQESMRKITNLKPWRNENQTTHFKEYADEKLNPRISKVIPFVDNNSVLLKMTVDGQEKNISITSKNAVSAFNAGVLPVNVLANKALAVYESKKIANEMSFNEKLDEQIKNEDGILKGFRK